MSLARVVPPIASALLLLACAAAPARPTAPAAHAVAAEAPRASATLPFIEDDYPRAVAEARARRLPLFVDVWAPW